MKFWKNIRYKSTATGGFLQGFSCQRADFRTMPFKNDTLYRKNENSPVELISDDLSWAKETNLEVIFEGQKQVKIGIPVLCRFGKIPLMKDNNFSPHNSEGKQLHLAVGLYEIWHPNYFWFLLNKWAQLQQNWSGKVGDNRHGCGSKWRWKKWQKNVCFLAAEWA